MIRTLTLLLAVAWTTPALALNVKPAVQAAKTVVDDAARIAVEDATRAAVKGGGDDVARGVTRLAKARPALAAVSDDLLAVARHADVPTARAVGELGSEAVQAAARSPQATARWGRLAHLAEAEKLSPAARRALVSHAQDGARLEALLKHAHKVGFGAALLAVGIGGGSAFHSVGTAIESQPELLAEPAQGVGNLFTLAGWGSLLALTAVGVGFALRQRRRGRPEPGTPA